MPTRASAGGIVLRPDGKMVLVEQHGNSWSFPKGRIEEGEGPLDAAVREIGEETGLTELSLVEELGSYSRYSLALDGKEEQVALGERPRTIFLFTTPQEALSPGDDEVTEARWVSVSEAVELLSHPKDKEFLLSVADRVAAALE